VEQDLPTTTQEQVLQEAADKSARLLEEVIRSTQSSGDIQAIVAVLRQQLNSILHLPSVQESSPQLRSRKYQPAMKYLHAGNMKTSPWKNGDAYAWSVVLGWLFTKELGRAVSSEGFEEISRSWMDEWMLNKLLISALNDLGLDERSNWRAVSLVKLLISHHSWWKILDNPAAIKGRSAGYQVLTSILSDSDALSYLGVNRYQDVLWFNKESFEDLLWWLFIISSVEIISASGTGIPSDADAITILRCFTEITDLITHAQASGYKLEKLFELVK
jgi:hypothetical protein